jgi:hypothetical protein
MRKNTRQPKMVLAGLYCCAHQYVSASREQPTTSKPL